MTIADVSLSMNLRLNKGDSQDYDNLWEYHKANAYNKAVNDWVRRQIRGKNQTQEGDEESAGRVDDLQVLLKPEPLSLTLREKGVYAESGRLPQDYLYHKRVTPYASRGRCKGVRIVSHLREEANADLLLDTCSFELEETFHTLVANRVRIYHNQAFALDRGELVYYRKPKVYDFARLDDPIEFKDDVCDLILDEACKILASDLESFNQKGLAQERGEQNN